MTSPRGKDHNNKDKKESKDEKLNLQLVTNQEGGTTTVVAETILPMSRREIVEALLSPNFTIGGSRQVSDIKLLYRDDENHRYRYQLETRMKWKFLMVSGHFTVQTLHDVDLKAGRVAFQQTHPGFFKRFEGQCQMYDPQLDAGSLNDWMQSSGIVGRLSHLGTLDSIDMTPSPSSSRPHSASRIASPDMIVMGEAAPAEWLDVRPMTPDFEPPSSSSSSSLNRRPVSTRVRYSQSIHPAQHPPFGKFSNMCKKQIELFFRELHSHSSKLRANGPPPPPGPPGVSGGRNSSQHRTSGDWGEGAGPGARAEWSAPPSPPAPTPPSTSRSPSFDLASLPRTASLTASNAVHSIASFVSPPLVHATRLLRPASPPRSLSAAGPFASLSCSVAPVFSAVFDRDRRATKAMFQGAVFRF